MKLIFLALFASILIFISGMMAGLVIYENLEQPEISREYHLSQYEEPKTTFQQPLKKGSPGDRIAEKDITLYKNTVVISLKDAVLAGFADTRSMEPVLTKDANAIEIIPASPHDIGVGDIISYESAFSEGTIIHRVIEKGSDEAGPWFRTKGDNMDYVDPEKIRFKNIKRVVVGILY